MNEKYIFGLENRVVRYIQGKFLKLAEELESKRPNTAYELRQDEATGSNFYGTVYLDQLGPREEPRRKPSDSGLERTRLVDAIVDARKNIIGITLHDESLTGRITKAMHTEEMKEISDGLEIRIHS